MSRQLTIEEVYKIIDQVEDEPIRNLLRIAYGQLRAEYEFDRGWKEANLPDLIRLDKRVKELEAEEDHLWTKINKMTVVIKRMDARIEELEKSLQGMIDMSLGVAEYDDITMIRQARKALEYASADWEAQDRALGEKENA